MLYINPCLGSMGGQGGPGGLGGLDCLDDLSSMSRTFLKCIKKEYNGNYYRYALKQFCLHSFRFFAQAHACILVIFRNSLWVIWVISMVWINHVSLLVCLGDLVGQCDLNDLGGLIVLSVI